MGDVLLGVDDLKKYYPVTEGLVFMRTVGHVRAVDGITFSIREGETLGLVGESGCGKTTTMKLILRLERPTGGVVLFGGMDVHKLDGRAMRDYRTKVQAVFQDPWASLSPRMKVREIISETLIVNGKSSRQEVRERVAEVLVQVGLRPEHAELYPHEFSGGQRQRIAVASALISNPKLIVLDEPVSALDVSIRAQVINLLKEIQEHSGVGYLLVAHNLATVRHLSHHTAVMYLGEIVESGRTTAIFSRPMHPYTSALLSASLSSRPDDETEQIVLPGEVPSPINPPTGCRFHPRCWLYERLGRPQNCRADVPKLRPVEQDHRAACHYAEDARRRAM